MDQVMSKEVENCAFRHNRIFGHTYRYKQPMLRSSSSLSSRGILSENPGVLRHKYLILLYFTTITELYFRTQ